MADKYLLLLSFFPLPPVNKKFATIDENKRTCFSQLMNVRVVQAHYVGLHFVDNTK